MTTIAYRNGVLAADTGMTVGGNKLGHVTKIARNERGDLAGASGDAAYNAQFCKWFVGGEQGDPPKPAETNDTCDRGVIFRRNGVIEVHEPRGVFPCRAAYYAMGSGRPEALGAMFVGASPEQAVRAAMAHDPHTFGDVEALSHE